MTNTTFFLLCANMYIAAFWAMSKHEGLLIFAAMLNLLLAFIYLK